MKRAGRYTHDEDLPAIEKVFAEEQKHYQQPMAVETLPLQNFYSAEEYHQDYLDKNPTGYFQKFFLYLHLLNNKNSNEP